MAGDKQRSAVRLAAWLMVALTSVVGQVRGQATDEMSRVLNAWTDHGSAVQAVRIEWEEQHLKAQGSKWPIVSGTPPRPQVVVLEHDVTHLLRKQMSIAGERMRYDFDGEKPSGDPRKTEHQVFRSAYDGETSKSFHPSPTIGYPCGFIHAEAAGFGRDVIHTRPVILSLFPNVPALGGLEPSELSIVDTGVIDGRTCLVLQSPQSSIWVDPAQGYRVVRETAQKRSGVIGRQTDVRYRADARFGWLPVEWRFTQSSTDGSLEASVTARVTKLEVNPEFPRDEFTITFPYGTVVTDSRVVDEQGRGRDFIVLENGVERPILDEERGMDYRFLLTHPPGELATARNGYNWLLIANVALVLILIVALLARMRLHSPATR